MAVGDNKNIFDFDFSADNELYCFINIITATVMRRRL
jgi:hypothetical protein